jgi:hypothetical protein
MPIKLSISLQAPTFLCCNQYSHGKTSNGKAFPISPDAIAPLA